MLLHMFGPAAVERLSRTWKLEIEGTEHIEAAQSSPGRLVALWHGRMLLGIPLKRGSDYAILVSPSADGSLMAPLLGRFGYRVVRGSTSQGGARALRELIAELKCGGTIVITPDGPRGPRHSTNDGLAWMARKTAYPMIPCGFATDKAWRLSSWDRFTIPKRGAKVVTVFGDPIYVTGPGEATLKRATEELKARMMAAEERAHEILGIPPDW